MYLLCIREFELFGLFSAVTRSVLGNNYVLLLKCGLGIRALFVLILSHFILGLEDESSVLGKERVTEVVFGLCVCPTESVLLPHPKAYF